MNLELDHLQAIVSAMHDLATTDGIHDTEKVMLQGFYENCQRDSGALASYADLTRNPFDITTVAALFDSHERKAALIHSCVLLGYADGQYSNGERAKVAHFAQALGLSPDALKQLEEAVSDQLLQQISRTTNTDSLRQVAAEM
jgi:uncharacterized membrane protein YebE (DUF533 family)